MLNDVLCVGTQVFADLPQVKVSKTKLFALVASEDRHLCFFTALGDVLTLSSKSFYETETAGATHHWCVVVTAMVEKCGSTGYKIGSVSESVSTEKYKT